MALNAAGSTGQRATVRWELLAVLATAILGAIALVTQLPPPHWGVFGFSIGTGVCIVGALIHPMGKHRLLIPAAVACLLVFLGGVTTASDVVAGRPWEALLFVAASGILAAGLPLLLIHGQWDRSQETPNPNVPDRRWSLPKHVKDAIGTVPVTAYAAALLVIAAWLVLKHGLLAGEALATVNVAEAAFDVMVFALFRDRFRLLVEAEDERLRNQTRLKTLAYSDWKELCDADDRRAHASEEPGNNETDEAEPPGAATIISLFAIGIGVLIALLGVIVEGADVLGMNSGIKHGQPSDHVFLVGGIAGGVVIALAIAADALGFVTRPATRVKPPAGNRPVIHIGLLPLGLAMLAAVILAVVPLTETATKHHVQLVAALGAFFYAAITWEALFASPLDVQLVRPGPGTRVLIFITGLGVGSALWWLLSTGLWADGGPAAIGRAVVASVIVLAPAGILAMTVQQLLEWSGTGEVFTPEQPWVNSFFDHGQYVFLVLIAAVIPVVGIAHIQAHETPVTVVSSLLFVPGLIGGFLWVMDNNRHHHTREQELDNPRRPMWDRAKRFLGDEEAATDEAKQWLGEYKDAMESHRLLQNFGAKAFLAVGMAALVVRSLGVA